MTTFVGWLRDQQKREGDPVGWFANYWDRLEGKPRLSSPASIAKHLEDRGLFQAQHGLTEAYDATLSEYRKIRAGVVKAAAAESGVEIPAGMVQDQLPLEQPQEAAQPPGRSLAGQAVDRATDAAVQAAQAHGIITPPQVATGGTILPNRTEITGGRSQLDRIERLLAMLCRQQERILMALGLAGDEDGGAVPAQLPWSDWYEQAAVFATAHGPGWDQLEGA
jgi:hypothetical protein